MRTCAPRPGLLPVFSTLVNCFPLLLLLVSLSAAALPPQIRFDGKELFDEKTGITVMAAKDKKVVVLSNASMHYAVVLPYSEKWILDINNPNRVKGNAEQINFDVEVIGPEDAQLSLESLRNYLMSHKNPVPADHAEIIEFKGQKVLRTEINAERLHSSFKGVKHINFYGIKKWKKTQYKYHLSALVKGNGPANFDETAFRSYVTVGFFPDFGR